MEAYDKIINGIKEYCHTNGFTKAIIGLSGGIDSAVTCCLAVAALGKDNVLYVSMPGPYSSEHSKEDAKKLADNLNVELIIIDICSLYEKYLEELKDYTKEHSIAEENIQARIRANILFFISNKEHRLVLATGNRSEALVGYGTLYGDLAGGLCPIGNLLKMEVYALAEYINSIKKVIPKNVIEKEPSAELAPNQKDSDSLPPYNILDQLLVELVDNKKSKIELLEMGFDEKDIDNVIERYHKSEFKRKQSPKCVEL